MPPLVHQVYHQKKFSLGRKVALIVLWTFILSGVQYGLKIPKWHPRSRQAVYIGHSPKHAHTVPVVLNLKTGHCSPQYHVVFDDNFTTVSHATAFTPPPNWTDLFTYHRLNVVDGKPQDAIPATLDPVWNDDNPQSMLSEGAIPPPLPTSVNTTLLARIRDAPSTNKVDATLPDATLPEGVRDALSTPTSSEGDPLMQDINDTKSTIDISNLSQLNQRLHNCPIHTVAQDGMRIILIRRGLKPDYRPTIPASRHNTLISYLIIRETI
jgi:hypothetical protein